MGKPKIGLKIENIGYDKPDKIDFKVIEILPKDPKVNLAVRSMEKIAKRIRGKDVSFHTQVARALTSTNKDLVELEDHTIRAEILFCKHLRIKEFIFHLKKEKLSKKEEKIVKDWLKFAKKNGVEMIYESNGKFNGNDCLRVLKVFPDLKYNLDLGHFNLAIGCKTLGMDLNEFLDKIKNRVVYVHAHNNNGYWDQHVGLGNGTLDWRYVLDKLDLSKVKKIIMEVRTTNDIKQTKKLLENYLKTRK